MLRTVLTIGVFAVLGLIALKLIFATIGPLLLLFLWLLKMALIVAVIGFLIYLAIRLVSPETARRFRDRWSGGSY